MYEELRRMTSFSRSAMDFDVNVKGLRCRMRLDLEKCPMLLWLGDFSELLAEVDKVSDRA